MLPKDLTKDIIDRLAMSKRKQIIYYMAGIVVMLLCHEVKAQGPPIFTETPIMLGLEGRGVRTFGKYISKKNVKTYIQPIAVPYNIIAKLQVGGILPLVYTDPEGTDSRFGIGDVMLFAKYQILQIDKQGKTFRTILKLTETFPTGKSESTPPLGKGAYQTALGWVSGYVTLKYAIYGEIAYNVTTHGLPDNFVYNLAFGVPLLAQRYPPKQLNIYLEFNGNYIIDNSANNLFFSPGVQWIQGRRFLLETGVQLPLIEKVPDEQKTNFMYTLGTRILIF